VSRILGPAIFHHAPPGAPQERVERLDIGKRVGRPHFKLQALLLVNLDICFYAMLLIAAALSEEVSIAKKLCGVPARMSCKGISAWSTKYKGKEVSFLKTGMGPVRSARTFDRFLREYKPSEVLVIGYAGALDPALEPGNLVMVQRAASLSVAKKMPIKKASIGNYLEMAPGQGLADLCKSQAVEMHSGELITSPFVVGDPAQKKWLYERFGAAIVDMETAELANIAASKSLPLHCVRAISDSATDDFLSPLSHDPNLNSAGKAIKLVAAGNWLRRCAEWRRNVFLARESLRRFLKVYLDAYVSQQK
jgi:adenosylhomocysteine nucleosidase